MDEGTCAFARYLAGEEAAFEVLVRLYRTRLIYFCNQYVHNLALAEEVAEDVFVALLLHPERYRTGTSMTAYLFGIARHLSIKAYHKHRRHLPLEDEVLPDEAYTDLAEQMQQRQDACALYAALETLPEQYRTALRLTALEGMSNSEAAAAMGKSNRQIENLVYRAKAALRRALEERTGIPPRKENV